MIETILKLSPHIRYAATNINEILLMKAKDDAENQSSEETDKYEELLVNPTILKLLEARGKMNCGGLDYVLIKYGSFFQFVQTVGNGHVSVCISQKNNVSETVDLIRTFLAKRSNS